MNTVLIFVCIALSMGIGIFAGVIVASRKAREKDRQVIELQTQAQGSEKVLNEIRQQLNSKKKKSDSHLLGDRQKQ